MSTFSMHQGSDLTRFESRQIMLRERFFVALFRIISLMVSNAYQKMCLHTFALYIVTNKPSCSTSSCDTSMRLGLAEVSFNPLRAADDLPEFSAILWLLDLIGDPVPKTTNRGCISLEVAAYRVKCHPGITNLPNRPPNDGPPLWGN